MIPLSVPELRGNEWKYIKECLDTNWVSSVGSFVTRFENETAAYTGASYAVATSNGTAALHISLMMAGVKDGDVVLMPDITFVAPANCVKYCNATPFFIDVDRNTWQMDLRLLHTFLEENCAVADDVCVHKASGKIIRVIMPVHVLGNMCNMELLMEIADHWKIKVVEDATEALGAKWNGKHAGTFGFAGCLSFNGNKIITTGGGGMILTHDKTLAEKAKHLTTQAKTTPLEYFHDEVGYNYRLVNLLAAMGVAQLEQLPGFILRKKQVAGIYNAKFENIPYIITQQKEDKAEVNNWLYTVQLPRNKELMMYLKENGIEARPLWVPMHKLPAFADAVFVTKENVSDELYANCLSLPCSSGITDNDIETVCLQLNSFYANG